MASAGVLGGARAQVRHLAARIDRRAEIIQVRQVQRLFIGERPRLYPALGMAVILAIQKVRKT